MCSDLVTSRHQVELVGAVLGGARVAASRVRAGGEGAYRQLAWVAAQLAQGAPTMATERSGIAVRCGNLFGTLVVMFITRTHGHYLPDKSV